MLCFWVSSTSSHGLHAVEERDDFPADTVVRHGQNRQLLEDGVQEVQEEQPELRVEDPGDVAPKKETYSVKVRSRSI